MNFVKINKMDDVVLDIYTISENPLADDTFYEVESEFVFIPTILNSVWKYMGNDLFIFKYLKDNSDFEENQYSYIELINLKVNKNVNNKELNFKDFSSDEEIHDYKIWFISDKEYFCKINTTDHEEDCLDFETNYLAESNKSVGRDPNTGHLIIKPRPVEASFFLNHLYFKTGIDSLDAGDCPFWSIDISTSGQTILTFQPEFSYYLEGGICNTLYNTFENDIKIQMVLAPDIPEVYGGSRYFIPQKIFKPLDIPFCYSLDIEAPPAYVKYYEGMPELNTLKIIIFHNASDNADFEIALRMYK